MKIDAVELCGAVMKEFADRDDGVELDQMTGGEHVAYAVLSCGERVALIAVQMLPRARFANVGTIDIIKRGVPFRKETRWNALLQRLRTRSFIET